MSLSSGTRLGPYEVIAPLGSGGMGDVYRARDARLGRDVAIKVLPEHLSNDPQALARFEREARAVAALSHPNILVIFDVGREQGFSYVVTELLEGETLRSRLGRGPMSWRKAAETGAALAEGLAAAHSKGIVHRDLKPENIFLTSVGHVKILDFGLARFTEGSVAAGEENLTQAQTQHGMVLGTVGYMSPEQVRGENVTSSSDIFSLGCVLHELISGRRAFQGNTQVESLSAILKDSPAELASATMQLPAELERLILHCLEKNPEERFQSGRDLAFGLKAVLGAPTSSSTVPSGPQEQRKVVNSIAVLPFANASRDPDAEYLSDGITESIINSLTQIGQLRVTPRSKVFRYKGQDVDPQAAGRELGAGIVLTGRVVQRGETLVVGAELIDVVEGMQLWGERYNRKFADIFAVEEEIASKISESLRMKLSGEEKKRIGKRYTENSEAYQLYLKGRHYWVKRTTASIRKGAEYFQQAIEKDPAYALAYSGLADAFTMLAVYGVVPAKEGWARAKAAAAAAVALDSELAECHTSWGFIRTFGDWDWKSAEEEFRRAIELNPAYWQAPYWYACVLGILGRPDEAAQQIRRAEELEPLSPIIQHVAALTCIMMRHYEQAEKHCRKGLEIDPGYGLLRFWLGLVYEQQSRFEEGIEELRNAEQNLEGLSILQGSLGHAHAVAGNEAEARRLLGELVKLAESVYVDPYALAISYIGLGEREQALDWLEKSCDCRSGWLTLWVKGDPRLDGLRSEPRFQAVLARMGLA